jgi:protein disulfide-isomerase-like protein
MHTFLTILCCLFLSCHSQYWGAPQPVEEAHTADSHVVTLTDDNFHSEVIAKGEPMFVQFHAPWCGHCKRLMPTWDALALELLGETRFGRIDCVPNEKMKDKYQIRGFPTLKLFMHGRSLEFKGMRSPESLKAFLSEHKAYMSQQEKPEKHVLHYHPWRGEAEPIRLTLAELGIPFEEVHYTEDEWQTKKATLEKDGVSWGRLPALQVGSEVTVSTGAILRRLAIKHDLYGGTDDHKTVVDVLLDDSKAFYNAYTNLVNLPEGKFEKERTAWARKSPDWLSYFNEQLKLGRELFSTDEPALFFAGVLPSVADMAVFHCVQMSLGMFSSSLDAQPELKEWFRRIGTRDNINDYLSSKFLAFMNGPKARFGNKASPENDEVNPFRNHA